MLLGLPRLKSFRRFSPHRFLALSPLPLLPSVIARAAGAADPEGFLASLLGPGSLRPAVYPALANLLGRAATRPFASPIPFAVEPGIKSANQADIRALCPNGRSEEAARGAQITAGPYLGCSRPVYIPVYRAAQPATLCDVFDDLGDF